MVALLAGLPTRRQSGIHGSGSMPRPSAMRLAYA